MNYLYRIPVNLNRPIWTLLIALHVISRNIKISSNWEELGKCKRTQIQMFSITFSRNLAIQLRFILVRVIPRTIPKDSDFYLGHSVLIIEVQGRIVFALTAIWTFVIEWQKDHFYI